MNNGNEPPARMQICLSPGRETEFIWSGLKAAKNRNTLIEQSTTLIEHPS